MSKHGNKFFINYKKIKHEIYTGKEEPKDKNQNQNINSLNKYNKIDLTKIKNEAFIDKLLNEEDKEIGFEFKLLKRNELNVNLIHFDKNITNDENYEYYNYFKVNVVGGFFAIDDINFFKCYLEVINEKNIPFIVISSGSSADEVVEICQNYPFIKEVIVFCGDYNKHKNKTEKYPNYVKKVSNSFEDIVNYIKNFGADIYRNGIKDYINSNSFLFTYEDIQMDKQFEQCPVISAFEYDNCYFLIHRAYAHFFGDMNSKDNVIFKKTQYNKVEHSINNSSIIKDLDKSYLIKKIYSLVEKDNFVELAIRCYTGESCFCYIFNRSMRNFESGLISLAYFMGPFLFGLNKYVKQNPKFAINTNMVLYRNIKCSIYDYYLYLLNLNHIICFPSITSTSTIKGEFTPTQKSKKINNNGIDYNELLNVTMIFNYKHEYDSISPGIIIKNYKGKDGKFLSSTADENEVILFPFTFVRITKLECISEQLKQYEIYFDIINRNKYFEYRLRDDVENRERFSNIS